MELIIRSNFDEVGARFAAAAAAAPGVIEAGMGPLGESVSATVVPIMAEHTPVVTGELAGSTEGEVTPSGMGAEVAIRQPATTPTGQEYVGWVILGRGDVFPVVAKALFIPGIGFRMHAGPSRPNDYNVQAMNDAEGPIGATMETAGMTIADAIVSVLG